MTVDLAMLRREFDRYQRETVQDIGMHCSPLAGRLRYQFKSANWGFVMYTGLPDDQVDTAIDEEIAYFRSQKMGFEWKYFDYDQPADLKQRLLERGFEPQETEAVMVLPIADAPEKLAHPSAHDIRKITDPARLADADAVALRVWKDAWNWNMGDTPITDRITGMWADDPQSVSLYIAYVDDQPASYGRVDFQEGNPFAGIWEGATLPEFRRRGLYQALVAARMREAIERGCRYLTVDARQETSMPILQRLGFLTIGYATAMNWSPD